MRWMKPSIMKTLRALWRYARWPLAVLFVLYLGLVVWRAFDMAREERSAEAVAYIHAQKITLADVSGKNLPPRPDPAEAAATIEGIDKNNNGIRDDVEWAIFDAHLNEPKIRAAQLQYAKALQLELTHVFDENTWVAGAIQNSRGYSCLSETYSRENLKEFIRVTSVRTTEVEDLTYNTNSRKLKKDEISHLTTSFSLPNKDFCDVSLNLL